jgi:hypothetical protein
MSNELVSNSLADEEWREYELEGGKIYRINNPQTLVYRVGGSTHRIVDGDGVVHLLPGPGYRDTVIRWKTREGLAKVAF